MICPTVLVQLPFALGGKTKVSSFRPGRLVIKSLSVLHGSSTLLKMCH